MKAIAVVLGLVVLSGCAVPYAQIDAGYQNVARTKDEAITRAWYLACRRDAFEEAARRHGQTITTWTSFLVTCGYARDPAVLTKPDPLVRSVEPVEESPGVGDFVDEPEKVISGRRTPDDGGPIDFGVID